jgi:uncharacterized membrane protein YjgN (DUF898 family)
MKNYLSFNLTGKKLLPVWILFMLFFLAPYLLLIFRLKSFEPGGKPSLIVFPLFILLICVAFALVFFMAKLMIENVSFKNKSVEFTGTFGQFIGKVLLGLFLCIITLGVYLAWFIRDIHRFFVNNSSFDSSFFQFKGKGGKLFVILLLTIMLPMIILTIFMTKYLLSHTGQANSYVLIQQLVIMFIMIPYMYLIYKWAVNIDYKDFHITWETDFWASCGKIAIEILLTIVTVGIYMPLAYLRLYTYFSQRTIVEANDSKRKFGYEIDPLNDFLFIWGQTLLMIITLGIYYPWAICKIGNRVLGKTYLTEY